MEKLVEISNFPAASLPPLDCIPFPFCFFAPAPIVLQFWWSVTDMHKGELPVVLVSFFQYCAQENACPHQPHSVGLVDVDCIFDFQERAAREVSHA